MCRGEGRIEADRGLVVGQRHVVGAEVMALPGVQVGVPPVHDAVALGEADLGLEPRDGGFGSMPCGDGYLPLGLRP
jgi:hypothetical protein